MFDYRCCDIPLNEEFLVNMRNYYNTTNKLWYTAVGHTQNVDHS